MLASLVRYRNGEAQRFDLPYLVRRFAERELRIDRVFVLDGLLRAGKQKEGKEMRVQEETRRRGREGLRGGDKGRGERRKRGEFLIALYSCLFCSGSFEARVHLFQFK